MLHLFVKGYVMETITWFGLPLIEWVGYAASTLVLISLSLSNIVKLRVFNLFGSALFSFYGFYIGALPVGIMNGIIFLFNLYYLRILYFKKEKFAVVEARPDDNYLQKFLNFYMKDIRHYFPDFTDRQVKDSQVLLALRDMNVAGVFIASPPQEGKSEIHLDYVTPQYRDYKMGRYIFNNVKDFFRGKKVKELTCKTEVPTQAKYLKKMGFEKDAENNTYRLLID